MSDDARSNAAGGGYPLPAFMPQLDALRTLAVAAVCIHHWVAPSVLGQLGVQLFFALSGFLITRILLDAFGDGLAYGGARRFILRQFYVRRALRIVPLFYATILGAAVVNVLPVRETLWWHLTYLSNLYFSLRGTFHGPISHLWSLAVEEQFYLLWPFVVAFVPRRRLPHTLWAAIVCAPLFRLVAHQAGLSYVSLLVLPPASFDSLGTGALLATIVHRTRTLDGRSLNITLPLLAIVGAGAFFAGRMLSPLSDRPLLLVTDTALAPFLGWLVLSTARGLPAPLAVIAEARGIRYLGKISYGLYMFHNFAPVALGRALRVLGREDVSAVPAVRLALLSAITIATAALSWHVFERPINRFKRYFPYHVASVTPTSPGRLSVLAVAER